MTTAPDQPPALPKNPTLLGVIKWVFAKSSRTGIVPFEIMTRMHQKGGFPPINKENPLAWLEAAIQKEGGLAIFDLCLKDSVTTSGLTEDEKEALKNAGADATPPTSPRNERSR